MSISTLIRSADDFEDWESEFAEPKHRPTRAAERRSGREAIEQQLGKVRHRSRERRED
jgi:hypothetical protein